LKLLTYRIGRRLRLGALLGDSVADLNRGYARYLWEERGEDAPKKLANRALPPDMLSFLDRGMGALDAARVALEYVERLDESEKTGIAHKLSTVGIASPIPRPRKNIFCLGMNYADHVLEISKTRGTPIPPPPKDLPSPFTKPPTAVVGPYDPIVHPRVTEKLDYEIELAFVIGRRGKYIPEEEAYEYVAGYTVFNDVSARDLQFDVGVFRGKGLDTFAPMGPYLVTKDEVPDPHCLSMELRVNGEVRQKSSTGNLIVKIPRIVHLLSAGMTLEPGDIVTTGTPGGVGIGRVPPVFLKPGDVVEATIEKIGTLRNRVIAED